MLKLKYLFENYSLAKMALRNWKHDQDNLDKLLSQFRISSNAIYPFSTNGKIRFLRLAPIDEKLENNVFGEIEFITYLNENSYNALKPVKSQSGDVILKLDTEWGTYYATAFEKVDGKQIENTDYSNVIMYEYGKALGKLHSLSSNYIPKIKKWDHNEALKWIRKMTHEYDAPSFVFEELDALEKELITLPMDTKHYGLVHYDFELDNVFYDESSKTCNVIDFDDGMYHWYSLDIVQVFDSLESELDGNRLTQAKTQFIKGYQSEFPYSDETVKMLPLMRRFCNLFAYARLIRSINEGFSDEPDWMATLRKKLKIAIQKLELSMQRL